MQPDIFAQLQADREAKRPVVLVTDLENGHQSLLYPYEIETSGEIEQAAEDALRLDKPVTVEHEGKRLFINTFNPPLRMIIVGAVHITQALAPMASLAGYDVTVIDPRRAWATGNRLPGVTLHDGWPDEAMEDLSPDSRTAVITLTHDPKLDDPALAVSLHSPAFYIGCLGSRRTHARRLERLGELGFGEADFARIHGPLGLPIGARSPAEIAVSAMAQITEVLRKGVGG